MPTPFNYTFIYLLLMYVIVIMPLHVFVKQQNNSKRELVGND